MVNVVIKKIIFKIDFKMVMIWKMIDWDKILNLIVEVGVGKL